MTLSDNFVVEYEFGFSQRFKKAFALFRSFSFLKKGCNQNDWKLFLIFIIIALDTYNLIFIYIQYCICLEIGVYILETFKADSFQIIVET